MQQQQSERNHMSGGTLPRNSTKWARICDWVMNSDWLSSAIPDPAVTWRGAGAARSSGLNATRRAAAAPPPVGIGQRTLEILYSVLESRITENRVMNGIWFLKEVWSNKIRYHIFLPLMVGNWPYFNSYTAVHIAFTSDIKVIISF